MIAAIFTLSYSALSVPVLVAGLATTHFGLHRTALAYCGILAVIAAAAAASYILQRPPPAKTVEPAAADRRMPLAHTRTKDDP